MLRLCVGSGQRPFAKPFINIDINPKWNPDVVADGASMPMFEDGSADVIVLSHTLEHYNLGKADSMLKECHRILASGGSLIVTVPNMRELAKAWLRGDIVDYIFFVNTYGAYMSDEADIHRWGFHPPTLSITLRVVAGWSEVKPFDFRSIPGMDLANDWWICGAEAIK